MLYCELLLYTYELMYFFPSPTIFFSWQSSRNNVVHLYLYYLQGVVAYLESILQLERKV